MTWLPIKAIFIACTGLCVAGSALAVDLSLPEGARSLAVRDLALGQYDLPLGPVKDDVVPSETHEGRISRRTWRISGSHTVLQVLAPLRDQLREAGYALRFECASAKCGGFDFRFGIEVVPAPDMTVNIGDFQFISASHPNGQVASLLVSRSGSSVYVQIITVDDADFVSRPGVNSAPTSEDAPLAPLPLPTGETDLVRVLTETGHFRLDDLDFASGATRLARSRYPSLDRVADFLRANPAARLLLVGHTDSVGALSANVDVSFKRATAVRQVLIEGYQIDPQRLEAAGAGYMAPLTSNLSKTGRDANRRVEIVLLQEN
ncbi:OmpA family protein [Epibacterium ulvae]|uniref:OmpA family protein n=1 Tax=Epibacterium ulvae TaxID=1156985 RepID=A0A1G5R5X6_9RHOB|nr:OmpA family protein [Epibacterium ulvae]SCZ69472.1 OmpA family protein [Epibacterium ulvae]